ncbi:unnamed protein product [Paramecium octaurelia]|uniref:Uncharacterized protein n=1 Tax=Paramecium octaurelia TaxID=43137 RepID=A0A8S1YMI7_PAROT|nr:unnamed protein product [Paramecium octaurelia]
MGNSRIKQNREQSKNDFYEMKKICQHFFERLTILMNFFKENAYFLKKNNQNTFFKRSQNYIKEDLKKSFENIGIQQTLGDFLARTGNIKSIFKSKRNAQCVCFSPNSKSLADSSYKFVYLLNLNNGNFSPYSNTLASGIDDNSIRLRDILIKYLPQIWTNNIIEESVSSIISILHISTELIFQSQGALILKENLEINLAQI